MPFSLSPFSYTSISFLDFYFFALCTVGRQERYKTRFSTQPPPPPLSSISLCSANPKISRRYFVRKNTQSSLSLYLKPLSFHRPIFILNFFRSVLREYSSPFHLHSHFAGNSTRAIERRRPPLPGANFTFQFWERMKNAFLCACVAPGR